MEKIKGIYAQYCEALEDARVAQWGMYSHLRVGILDGHVISGLFPKIINRLEKEYRNIRIELFRGSFRNLTDSLYNDSADLIITLEFSIRDMNQVLFLPISKTRDYLVLPKAHPLANSAYISAEDLSHQVLISISQEDSPFAYEHIQQVRTQAGCYLPQKDAPTLETCTLWTQAGLGITILNSHNALAHDPEIKFFKLDKVECFDPLDTDLVIAWHRDNSNNALQAFVDVLKDVQKSCPTTPPPPID